MNTTRICPRCHAPLPSDAPEGLCPQCLLQSEPAPASAPGSESGAPSVEDVARHFPQWEILERIGAGGMGVVYRARQPKLDRVVALKILPAAAGTDPAFAERFTREARILARLNHPGIVAIYDFGQAGPFYYFLMEYVEGTDMRQMLAAGLIPPDGALNLVTQICDALQFAHTQGVVHRDIKPGNILVDRTGRVKIADFGLAKILGQTEAAPGLTGTHHVLGTLDYMAPEQRARPKSVDHRADIYSLGVVFYEMLTGDLPVGRFAPPSRRVQVDVRLDEVVLRTLEREPEHRYQHVSEVKSRVEDIAGGATPRPRGSRLGAVAATLRRMPRWFAWAGVALMVVLAAAGMFFPGRSSQATLRESPPSFGHATPESRWLIYEADVPANHRLRFWVEWWEHGRPARRADLTVDDTLVTARNQSFQGEVSLVFWDDPLVPGKPTNLVRWQWGIRGGNLMSGASNIAVDPFDGLRVRDSSYGHESVRVLKSGDTATLAVLRGDREQLEGDPWDPLVAGRADIELHFKARLDRVLPATLGDQPRAEHQAPH